MTENNIVELDDTYSLQSINGQNETIFIVVPCVL